MTSQQIEDLLRADEERLRAKKARLKDVQKHIDAFRSSAAELRNATAAIIHAGDMSRRELSSLLELSRAESSIGLPKRVKASDQDLMDDDAPSTREQVGTGQGEAAQGQSEVAAHQGR